MSRQKPAMPSLFNRGRLFGIGIPTGTVYPSEMHPSFAFASHTPSRLIDNLSALTNDTDHCIYLVLHRPLVPVLSPMELWPEEVALGLWVGRGGVLLCGSTGTAAPAPAIVIVRYT